MAIQHRRGDYTDFDPSKMKPAEIAVVLTNDPGASDGKAIYIGVGSGNVKRIATVEDIQADIQSAIDSVSDQVDDYLEAIEEKGEDVLESIPSDYSELSDEVDDLKADLEQIEGLTDDIKEALLACFRNVAYTTSDSQTLYDNLYDALYASDTVASISAVYTQGAAVIYPDESLDNLRASLIVTATYVDSHTGVVTGYSLSGTLVGGTSSTITVTYMGKTTTFTVAVTDYEWGSDYTWLYRAEIDGLLSDNENVGSIATIGGTTPATEAIDGTVLNLSAEYNGADHGSIFKLVPLTVTNGVLKVKVRFNELPISSPGGGFRIQVSNGTNGAQIYVCKNNSNQYKLATFEAGTHKVLADVQLNTWYIITCELSNSGQVLKLNDTVYNVSTLSSYANTETRVIILQPSDGTPGNTDFDIAWISFKDNSAQ